MRQHLQVVFVCAQAGWTPDVRQPNREVAMSRSIMFGAAMLLVAFAGGCTTSGEQRASRGDTEAMFLSRASRSYSSEIEVSRLAQERATDKRVKAFADMMVKDHTEGRDSLMKVAH